ncbi:IS66 family insertion sequence element accessory protein TnpB [Paraburkholderia monticola]|uniref:IS66 family insertion sequence element accessory protein TnpB n=1 Tax=Paraburkholderia monticola TaxID=1399968 RepID=UPI0009EEF3B3
MVNIRRATGDGIRAALANWLERGRFIWPQADGGKVHLSAAQLSILLDGLDWRWPRRTAALSMMRAAHPTRKPRRMSNGAADAALRR